MSRITVGEDGILYKDEDLKDQGNILLVERKNPMARYQAKKDSKLVRILQSQLLNAPQFLEQISKKGEIALDISEKIAKQIASGELVFSQKTVTGDKVGILRHSKTGRLFTQLPLKNLPIELGASMATAGISHQIQEISLKLEILGDKINQVNRNFDLNRYAEVQSAREKFQMSILMNDNATKNSLLKSSLSQATDAKNLLLNQLYEIKNKFMVPQNKSFLPFLTKELSVEDAADFANIALENLSYLKDAFSFQIASLTELKEYAALSYVVSDFKQIVEKDFSGDNALFLDGKLEIKSNPFKYLSENVIETSDTITKYIEDNEDLLELHFMPNSLMIEK